MGIEFQGLNEGDNVNNPKSEQKLEPQDKIVSTAETSKTGLENVVFNSSSVLESSEHHQKVESVKEKIREALRGKNWSDKQIEKKVESLEIDLLDPRYVEEEKNNLFRKYGSDIEEVKEEYYEEFCNFKYGRGTKSSYEEVRKLEERINDVNSEVECYCYTGVKIVNEKNTEKTIDRLCGFLKDGLSEDEYKGITDLVKEYFKKYRNTSVDLDLEKILYDIEMSTMQPFPLEGSEKVNYFTGRIYSTIAPVIGRGFREAMEYLSQCSPEVFCTLSKNSGLHYLMSFRNGPSYEDIINVMIRKADMPRWLGLGFLPIKDSVLSKLVTATSEYMDRNYENARDAYKALYDYARDKDDKVVANYVAIMIANCENTMIRENEIPHYIHYSLENNGKVFTWLEKSKCPYAQSLLEGLRVSLKEKLEKSKGNNIE